MTGDENIWRDRYHWLVFGLLCAGYMLIYFHRLAPAVAALDLMRDLEAGPTMVGLLASAYFYPYALMQPVAGLLADSWGPRRTIVCFFGLAGAASVGFGLADSLGVALAARLAVCLGVSALFVPAVKILSRWYSADRFGPMMGLFIAAGGAGMLLAGAPLAWFCQAFGWRPSFVVAGVATGILSVLIWRMVRDDPAQLGLPAPAGPRLAGATRPGELWRGVGRVLGDGGFWATAVWLAGANGCFFAYAGLWGGPYLIQAHGLSQAQAGQVLSMTAPAVIVFGPILGHLSQKVLRSRRRALIPASAALVGVMSGLAFLPAPAPPWMLYGLTFCLAVVASAVVVVPLTLVCELFPAGMAATATGLANLFPFLGGALLQFAVGVSLESSAHGRSLTSADFSAAFTILVAAAAAALVASLFLPETIGPRARRPPA